MRSSAIEVTIPLVDLRAQYTHIQLEIDEAISNVLGSSQFIGGNYVGLFEQAFAEYCGVKHAVGVGNGTDALELILEALGVGHGDEVVVPAMTFAATAEAVVRRSALPVFADCERDSMNVSTEAVDRAITAKTKAVIAVHLYGQPADIDALRSLSDDRGLILIEDAAQAHGAVWNGRRVGSFGVAAAFSFYPGKNLGAYGDAGAVVTSDSWLAERVRLLANHGRREKYVHDEIGRNSRLDSLQAAVLSVKLAHLDRWNDRRREIAARYRKELAGKVRLLQEHVRASSVYHLFVVLADNRDEVRQMLRANGVATGIHYPVPLHRQPAFRPLTRIPETVWWWADEAASKVLSLPMYPELSDDQVDTVCEYLRDALGGPDS